MKLKVIIALIPAIALMGASLSRAQTPIRDLQRNRELSIPGEMHRAQIPIRDLQGNRGISISGVIRSVVGNEFILDDGTGQVIVDAGPRWYRQLSFTPGERVTVVGEYDDDDFDAYTITRSGGEVIQIRPAGGPPPWAGGRGRRNR